MRIVVVSLTFLPNVGGLENIMAGLAESWSQLGHQVTVYTQTASAIPDNYSYKVVRTISPFTLYGAVKKADILLEANISLQTFLVGLLHSKKWIVTHHLPYQHDKGWKGKLKNWVTKFSHNIAISHYIANQLKGKATVINNFYHPIFKNNIPYTNRKKDLVFVGRLVSDKGANLLIESLKMVQEKIPECQLTIIGSGIEKEALQKQAKQLNLHNDIVFEGVVTGNSLVSLLNEHKVMVIPSVWDEPFGVVALEGLACGCAVVCADRGGLREALGNWGFYYKNNNSREMAAAIEHALMQYAHFAQQYQLVHNYLQEKKMPVIALQYVTYFKTIA